MNYFSSLVAFTFYKLLSETKPFNNLSGLYEYIVLKIKKYLIVNNMAKFKEQKIERNSTANRMKYLMIKYFWPFQ